MFEVTSNKPEYSLFADKFRVSLNRLAVEDPSFVAAMRQRDLEAMWRDVFGDSPCAPPVPSLEQLEGHEPDCRIAAVLKAVEGE